MRRVYAPGICNIGMRNRLGRLAFGLLFFSFGVWSWTFLRVNYFHPVFKLYLFIPFYLGFIGIYEAVFGFCVYHSFRRSYDMR